ncbi:hypothetical protein BJX76DRAFT_333189 [Aspergillus varians]
MSDYPSSSTPIKTIGLREVCEVNSRTFTRRRGTLIFFLDFRTWHSLNHVDKGHMLWPHIASTLSLSNFLGTCR